MSSENGYLHSQKKYQIIREKTIIFTAGTQVPEK